MRISFFFLLSSWYKQHTRAGDMYRHIMCDDVRAWANNVLWEVIETFPQSLSVEERKIKHRKCIVIRRWRRRHKTLAIHNKMMIHLIWHHQNCHRQILSLRLLLMSNGGIDNHALPSPPLRHTHTHTRARRRWHRFPCETIFNNRGMFIFKDNYFNYALCSMCSVINVDHVSVNLIF